MPTHDATAASEVTVTTHPVFPNMNPVQVGTGDNAFLLMQGGTGWNIVAKTRWSEERWTTWWHTGHTEDEARREFADLSQGAFFGATRWFWLIDADGNVVGKHRRGENGARYFD